MNATSIHITRAIQNLSNTVVSPEDVRRAADAIQSATVHACNDNDAPVSELAYCAALLTGYALTPKSKKGQDRLYVCKSKLRGLVIRARKEAI